MLKTLGIVLPAIISAGVLLALMGADKPSRHSAGDKPRLSREEEKKVLEYLDHLLKDQSKGMLNVPPEDGRLLRVLAESTQAKHVVEIGTSNGYSGIWICLGLKNTGGELTTYELDAKRAELARENFKNAGVDKMVTLVVGDAHQEVAKLKEPIDMVFIDADKQGYADYLKKLLPLVKPGGLIVAHNTTNSAPDLKDYVQAITTNPDLDTVFMNSSDRGIGVTLKKR